MDELSFRGVLTYTRDDHQESLRVTHGLYNGELYERLEHLDGERREVIRHGEQLTCIQLGQRLDRLFHRHLLKEGLADLDSNYVISIGDEMRIAGRRAIALNIKPRDEFRYGYRLALDYDTGLLLRFESLNHAGHVLERLQFVDVQIGEPLKREWLGDAGAAPAKGAPNPDADRARRRRGADVVAAAVAAARVFARLGTASSERGFADVLRWARRVVGVRRDS